MFWYVSSLHSLLSRFVCMYKRTSRIDVPEEAQRKRMSTRFHVGLGNEAATAPGFSLVARQRRGRRDLFEVAAATAAAAAAAAAAAQQQQHSGGSRISNNSSGGGGGAAKAEAVAAAVAAAAAAVAAAAA